jgi:small subunit ribosomal protein S6
LLLLRPRVAGADQTTGGAVKDYEVVYIFDTQVPEERIAEKLDRFHQLLTANGGGEVTAVDHWGRRQLSYPIRKRHNGYYVIAQFRSIADSLPEFERLLKLDEELIRYLVVLNEGLPTAPMSVATREPRREEDSDDDEEDDE